MSTWHQDKAGFSVSACAHQTEWAVVENPPNGCASVMTWTTEEKAREFARIVTARNPNAVVSVLPPTNSIILDCGHPESPHSSFTRGYGIDSAGRKSCYDCCNAKDLEQMRTEGRIDAYLNSDGSKITNWPGHPLMTITREWETSAGGFCRGTTITRVWARAADGSVWYGRGPGRGMYIKMHRSNPKKAAQ